MPLDCYVFFDVDDTLVQWNLTWQEAFAQVAREAGVECTTEQARRALDEAFTGVYKDVIRKHAPRGDVQGFWLEYNAQILVMLGVSHDLPHLTARVVELLSQPGCIQLFPEAHEALGALQDRGAKLGIVTGRPVAQDDLNRLGVAHYFTPVLDAFGTRSTKDEGVMFGLALEAAKEAGRPAWYVGDNYAMDVLGARAAGLRPILVDRQAAHPEPDCACVRDLREILPIIANGAVR
jgi:FMN phosphatase YigB (HAD superfamily)